MIQSKIVFATAATLPQWEDNLNLWLEQYAGQEDRIRLCFPIHLNGPPETVALVFIYVSPEVPG